MIVVDTNIICYLYLSSELSAWSEQIVQKDPHWIAPRLWQSEFRNVLVLYLRQNLLSFNKATIIIAKAEKRMLHRSFAISSELVMSLAVSSTCSAYDCEFVALAQDYEVPLVTFDRKLWREFPKTAVSPTIFLKTGD